MSAHKPEAARVRRALQLTPEELEACPVCSGRDPQCCACGFCEGCYGVELADEVLSGAELTEP